MIRDEILNMPAGKDMDELIKTLVMGEEIPPPTYWIDEYSTDIAAAWQVLEHLMATGHERFEAPAIFRWPDTWMCVFYEKNDTMSPMWIEATADTVSLAICRASLLATVEVEE